MSLINLCLACDENYAFLAEVAMTSVMIHNSDVTVYLLDNGLSADSKKKMACLSQRYNAHIEFIDCMKIVEKVKSLGFNPQGRYNSYSAYLRLFLVDFLPTNVERILYIDCDVTCENDISELFSMDLNGCVLAAITDLLPILHRKYIGFEEKDEYFNSGVLLIDVDLWRKRNSTKRIQKLLDSGRNQYPFHDQDLINIVFKNEIFRLEPKYMTVYPVYGFGSAIIEKYYEAGTLYEDCDYKEAYFHPVLIHHLDNIEGRPWESNCMKDSIGARYWLQTANITFNNEQIPCWERKTGVKTEILRLIYKTFPILYFCIMKHKRSKSVKYRCEQYK